ncbi:MAG: cupin domain-containing protein [Caldilineaceae bacterium]|nr:cupin domain-containing protein [Caldilineaceae bacterium]MBP8107250.1 cupin domain-containing protein [Caldilineaceae bacterium]MBP8121352.1 cupin domain-containing protein [Caldilineaceae bacterium]MBP9070657.1 cupin domain-containing protein [Caldilineaceae bacterium]
MSINLTPAAVLPFQTVTGDGANGLSLARLYQNREHFTFQLAQVEAGGISKRHHHVWEQVTWVATGSGEVQTDDGVTLIAPGDFFEIPSNVSHAIANTGEGPLLLVTVLGPGA